MASERASGWITRSKAVPGSVTAPSDRFSTVGIESVGRVGLSPEGRRVRGCRERVARRRLVVGGRRRTVACERCQRRWHAGGVFKRLRRLRRRSAASSGGRERQSAFPVAPPLRHFQVCFVSREKLEPWLHSKVALEGLVEGFELFAVGNRADTARHKESNADA